MIELTVLKIKAAVWDWAWIQKLCFKSCFDSNTGKWTPSKCLEHGIECPNAYRARLASSNCILCLYILHATQKTERNNKLAKFQNPISSPPVCLAFHYIYLFPLTSVNEVRKKWFYFPKKTPWSPDAPASSLKVKYIESVVQTVSLDKHLSHAEKHLPHSHNVDKMPSTWSIASR